jgi:aryl-alcohol dehydrogenase-like predicted oxidoreductase
MKHHWLPGLDQGVSQLVLGTQSEPYRPRSYEQAAANLDAFLAAGGNTIDTAFVYGQGESEQTIGRWLEERGNREKINIWTKGGHPDRTGRHVDRASVHEQLTISLDRLGTDYVDLYALHRDDPEVPVGEIVEFLNEEVEAGRVRCLGTSNWSVTRQIEANRHAAEHGLRGFEFSSPNLSLAKAQQPYWPGCVSADDRMLAWHAETSMPLLAWSSQARGFFSGRYTPADTADAELVRVFYNHANWQRYQRAEQLGQRKGVSTIQIALAYVLNQPFPTAAVVGPSNAAEVASCRAATALSLTADELAWLDLRNSE